LQKLSLYLACHGPAKDYAEATIEFMRKITEGYKNYLKFLSRTHNDIHYNNPVQFEQVFVDWIIKQKMDSKGVLLKIIWLGV